MILGLPFVIYVRAIDKYKVVSNNSSFYLELKFCEERNMHNNHDKSALIVETNDRHKWWHNHRAVIVCISLLIVLTIFIVTLCLLLIFVALKPKEKEATALTSAMTTTTITPTQRSSKP